MIIINYLIAVRVNNNRVSSLKMVVVPQHIGAH